MSNLPPGVTNSMCEPYNPTCGSKYHLGDEHCDYKGCSCEEFAEGEYEPEDDR